MMIPRDNPVVYAWSCPVLLWAYLDVMHLQHGEELVEAGTQHGDGGGLHH